MCVMQVGTLVLQRSHKYFELEIFQFYLWSRMLCTSGLADMEHATSPTIGIWLPTVINEQNQTQQKTKQTVQICNRSYIDIL